MADTELAPSTPLSWRQFLESHPPDSIPRLVSDAVETAVGAGMKPHISKVEAPLLLLPCDSAACKSDERIFEIETQKTGGTVVIRHTAGTTTLPFEYQGYWLSYRCRNCRAKNRLFLVLLALAISKAPYAIKLAEWPPFGEKVSDQALHLVGSDRQFFLQGRKAENRGLGIGAFAYYRRVLNNQKSRIINEICKVAQRLNAPPEMLKQLEEAQKSWRFENAVDKIKDAIPDSLRINGQNPLVLLHKALSDSLHDENDGECLSRARAIRLVLTELAGRIESALEEREELDGAVAELLKITEERSKKKSGES